MIPALLILLTQQAASQSSEASLSETSSIVWADVDGDGRLDLAAIRAEGSVQLLRNTGAGGFEDATGRFGLSEVTDAALLAWADYDADGRLDVFVGAREGASRLYHNEGGSFIDMSAGSGLVSAGPVRGAYWLDHDGDTRLDLVVLTAEGSELFRGLEGGFFDTVRLPFQALAPASGEVRLAGTVPASPAVVIEDGTRAGAPSVAPGLGDEPAHGSPLGGRLPTRGPANRGGLSVAPSPGGGGSQGALLFPASCAATLKDQANPGTCLLASTTPTLGELYPLSTNLFVSPGGDVGLGITTPVAKLDVQGSARVTGTVTALQGIFGTGSTAVGINSTVSGGELNFALGNWSFAAGRRAKANHEGSFVWGDSVSIDKTSSASDQFNVYAESGARVFAVGQTTPSLVVDPAGKLGLGTSSPLAVLDILGGADAGGGSDPVALALQHRSGGFRHFIRSRHNSVANDAGNGLDFFLNSTTSSSGSSTPGTGNVNCMTLNATLGNRLQVTGGIAVDANETADGTYTGPMLRFGSAGSGEGVLSKRTAGGNLQGLDLVTGGVPRVSITNGGNVGIGVPSPTVPLEVFGNVNVWGTVIAQKGAIGTACIASDDYSTVSGGVDNTASGLASTVSGGANNTASSDFSAVSGGRFNTASGPTSMVLGGTDNTASGNFSLAAGVRAMANHLGAFVWGDSAAIDKTSSANNQFNVYASGGVRMFSNSAATAGVLLAPGGGSWSSVSDRASKENLEPVDPRGILERVCALPISTWNYLAQDDSIRHMGPMAQDFHAAFGLGVSDKTIDTIDPDGVALAAIQGLNARLSEAVAAKDAEIAELRERVTRLESLEVELANLEATLHGLVEAR